MPFSNQGKGQNLPPRRAGSSYPASPRRLQVHRVRRAADRALISGLIVTLTAPERIAQAASFR